MSSLDQLRKHTIVVADTGDIDAIAAHCPRDATTNPSLLYKASQLPRYSALIDQAIAESGSNPSAALSIDDVIDRLAVIFGSRILEIVPGRVSTEVDAGLSFDGAATLDRARRIMELYAAAGVDCSRVLIKIAATWEGIRAAEQLEREGIHCNLTLLFSFGQAVACADAGVTLISPFVGRIYDWYRKSRNVDSIPVEDDPGVLSVTRIFNYYKRFGYQTEVMGASFRTMEQVIALCGCDLLTIAPELLAQLQASELSVPQQLNAATAGALDISRLDMDERRFRWDLNEDAMATEKLAEGIRGFNGDLNRLRAAIRSRSNTRH